MTGRRGKMPGFPNKTTNSWTQSHLHTVRYLSMIQLDPMGSNISFTTCFFFFESRWWWRCFGTVYHCIQQLGFSFFAVWRIFRRFSVKIPSGLNNSNSTWGPDDPKVSGWCQIFFIFTTIWGNDPICLIFFKMGWNHQPERFGRGDKVFYECPEHPGASPRCFQQIIGCSDVPFSYVPPERFSIIYSTCKSIYIYIYISQTNGSGLGPLHLAWFHHQFCLKY